MSLIREKATESEAVVRNITADIQVLDLAKKNLILSMTVLKRLQMLVNALHHLEGYIQERNYEEIAQSLAVSVSPALYAYYFLIYLCRLLNKLGLHSNHTLVFLE